MADLATTIKLILSAEDNASATLDALQKNGADAFNKIEGSATTSSEKIKTAWNGLKEHWVGITVAIGAAWVTVSKAWDLASDAAQYEEQKAALDILAAKYDTTADAIIESIKRASNGQVSLVEAVNIASNALLKGLNPTQLEEFMKIAAVVSNATGKSVAESFEGITTAVANGQEKLLKTQGIIVDLSGAWEDWGKANGRTVDSLTEVEKQAISADAVIAAMADKVKALGEAGESTDDKMAQFKAMMADLKLAFGEILIKAIAGTVSALFGFSAVVNEVAGIVLTGIAAILEGFSKIPGIGGMFDSLAEEVKGWAEQSFMAAEDAAKKSETAYNTIFDSAEKASGGIKKVAEAQDDGKLSSEEYAEAVKKYGEAFKVVNGKIVPLTEATKDNEKATKDAEKATKDKTTADKEAAKELEKNVDAMVKFKLGLEEIQSKERVSIFEIQAKVDMAAMEQATKQFETMFESINHGMDSTSETMLGLFGELNKTTDPFKQWKIEAAIEKEIALRQKEFELQEKLITAQIEYMTLKTQALSKGEALINITGDGLEPELEAFMWQILKRIQIRANAEGAEYLLGI